MYTGPSEASEPEIKNELWVADTFPNIKFSNNIHSSGGYFMWAPGTYLPNRDEGEAVHANIGVEKYFFEAGDQILNRIKDVRGTAILPERTGPIADVLYSAAGNSADEHWYRRGVIAYSFEVGRRPLRQHDAVGGLGGRSDRHQAGEPDRLPAGRHDHVRQGHRRPRRPRRSSRSPAAAGTSPAPNVTLTAPLTFAHAAGGELIGGLLPSGVGFQPPYALGGQVRGARVRGRQLRPARVGVRLRVRRRTRRR